MRRISQRRRTISTLASTALFLGVILSAYLAWGQEKESEKRPASDKHTSEIKRDEGLLKQLNEISVKKSLKSEGVLVDLPSLAEQQTLAKDHLDFLRKTTTRVFGDEKIFSPNQVTAGMVVAGRFGGTFTVSQAMSDSLVRSKKSIALIVNNSFFDDSTGKLTTKTLRDYRSPLCPNDGFAFGGEPIVPFAESSVCTGALVGPNLLLTAHHCIPNAQSLSGRRFLFDYGDDAQGKIRTSFLPSEIYVAKLGSTPVGPPHYDGVPGADWVLVEIVPKEPQAREPLQVLSSAASIDERLYMLGHPLGLSLKADLDGSVKMLDSAGSVLLALLDSFVGNSGSPVFDQISGKIVGVVSGGEGGGTDLSFEGGCYSVSRCKTGNCDPVKLTSAINFEPTVTLLNKRHLEEIK
jgi:hypothetical protein